MITNCNVLDAALALARMRIPVFPCLSDKRPATPHGFHDATTDANTIQRWRWRGRLIGVPTGHLTGFAVLDIDVRHDGDVWLDRHFDRLPITRVHGTRGGGFHLFFRHRYGLRGSASKVASGVDIRAEGGYLIWWPADGIKPIDDAPLAELAPWPSWVFDAARAAPQRPAAKTGRHARLSRPAATGILSSRQVEGVIRRVAGAHEGERNALLFWGACRLAEMLRPGFLSQAEAERMLTGAAGKAGLTGSEVARTIESGMRCGGRS